MTADQQAAKPQPGNPPAGARARLRGWLATYEPPIAVSLPLWQAIAGVLLLFFIGWSAGLYRAAVHLLGGLKPQLRPDADPINWVLETLASGVAIVALAILLIRAVAGSWSAFGEGRGRERWRTEILGGSWGIVMGTIPFLLAALFFGESSYPFSSTPAGQWVNTASALTAGPTEELALLVAPIVLLRAARVPWPWVFATLALLRVSFHIYYGWGSGFMVLWAVGVAFVYLRTRAVVGLAVAHTLFDITSAPSMFGYEQVTLWLKPPLIVAASLIVIRAVGRWADETFPPGQDPSKFERVVIAPAGCAAVVAGGGWLIAQQLTHLPPADHLGGAVLAHPWPYAAASAGVAAAMVATAAVIDRTRGVSQEQSTTTLVDSTNSPTDER